MTTTTTTGPDRLELLDKLINASGRALHENMTDRTTYDRDLTGGIVHWLTGEGLEQQALDFLVHQSVTCYDIGQLLDECAEETYALLGEFAQKIADLVRKQDGVEHALTRLIETEIWAKRDSIAMGLSA